VLPHLILIGTKEITRAPFLEEIYVMPHEERDAAFCISSGRARPQVRCLLRRSLGVAGGT
jgi:hypothetical protein